MKKLIKSSIVSLAALMLSLSIPAVHAADAAMSETPSATPEKSKNVPFHGDVTAVDATAKTFTIIGKKGNARVFTVGDSATVQNGDAAATFADIKVGAYVRGNCTKIAPGKFDVIKVIIGKKEDAAATPSASPAK